MKLHKIASKFVVLLMLPQFVFSSAKIPILSPGIKVKAIPPVYSVEIKDVTLYEATIPIFFHIQLPKIPEEFPFQKDHIFQHKRNCSRTGHSTHNNESNATRDYIQYHCALERQFVLASNHIVKDLKQMQKMQIFSKSKHENFNKGFNNTSRNKRQAAPIAVATSLLAGFLLRPAVSKFTGNLFGSNEEWSTHFNSMRESLIKDHQLLLDFEQSTQAYTQEMSDILTTMSELLSEQKRDLIWSLRLLSTKMHADLIQSAIHSCKTRHLPGNLIQPDFLQKTLSALDKNLTATLNYTLAINADDDELGKYYKLPIVDCLFSKDKAHITVNIPLKSKQAQWKLYEIIHTKFAFHHQICEVYPQEAAYLAEETGTGSRSVLISSHMLKYCSIYEDRLCMVPQFSKDSVQSLKCTSLAAKVHSKAEFRDRLETLLKSCSFRCYPNDEVVITQVDEAKVVVTNAYELSYQCDGSAEHTIPVGKLGAVEVNLECDCSIKINGKERLSRPFPCAYSSPKESSDWNGHEMFSFTVPFQWAHNLTQILEQDEEGSQFVINDHRRLSAHVNPHWARLVPVLNFTEEQTEMIRNFTVPEKAEFQYSSVILTVEVWLGILTIVVLLHVGVTLYCCSRMFLAKFGEYELPPAYRGRDECDDGCVTRRTRSSEQSHHQSHNNRHSRSSNYSGSSSSCKNVNRRQNFEIYQAQQEGQHDTLNESQNSNDGTTASMKSREDSYHSNRNSVINKLI